MEDTKYTLVLENLSRKDLEALSRNLIFDKKIPLEQQRDLIVKINIAVAWLLC